MDADVPGETHGPCDISEISASIRAKRHSVIVNGTAVGDPHGICLPFRVIRCAPKGAITSWVQVPPGQWPVGPVAIRRLGWVTVLAKAL